MTHSDDGLEQAARLIEQALVRGERLEGLPEQCRPTDHAQAYEIQRRLAHRLGQCGGWKVGAKAPDPEAPRHYSPLPASLVREGPVELAFSRFSYPALEAEVAFKLGKELPARERPYSPAEVREAVASVHAVIELVDSRFMAWPEGVDALTQLADLQNNGFLVVGEGVSDWQSLALDSLAVTLSVDDAEIVNAQGGNPAGDPFALLVWLANALPDQGQALHAGEIVTCGSCTGKHPAKGPLDGVATFESLGRAELRLV
jgi:2-keto-4-pentenoate hydratase